MQRRGAAFTVAMESANGDHLPPELKAAEPQTELMSVDEYMKQHIPGIEAEINLFLEALMAARPANSIKFMAEYLSKRSGGPEAPQRSLSLNVEAAGGASPSESFARRSPRVSVKQTKVNRDIVITVDLSARAQWVKAFLDCDPRRHLCDYFKPGDERGPFGYLRAQSLRPRGPPSHHFAVWRPTSLDAMRMLFDGSACGKALNIKGKSARSGVLSGFVPFLQIDEADKGKVGTSPADARSRVFFRTKAARNSVRARLEPILTEMEARATKATQLMAGWKLGKMALDEYQREECLHDLGLLWKMKAEHETLIDIDEHARPEVPMLNQAYGLDMPERLLWQAFVVRQDISHPPGWEPGRPSEPAFMDLNLQAMREKKKPLAAIWQYDRENPMNPRGLLMAHEEEIGVRPVASDIDAFLIGSKGMEAGPPLPDDQLKLAHWCLANVAGVLETPMPQGWTRRWLDVLKHETVTNGVPKHSMPEFGYGDPRSYDIIVKIVQRLNFSGAVRHGAECFNFYFPQELDTEFLVCWEGFKDYVPLNVPWAYVDQAGLKHFLMARLQEGYSFPLNPKWILCDPGFRDIFDAMQSAPHAQESLDSWLPAELRKRINELLKAYPEGFQPVAKEGESVIMIDNDMAEWELRRHAALARAKAKLKAVHKFNMLIRDRRKSRSMDTGFPAVAPLS